MINALGDDLDAIVPALAAGMSPGMANAHTGVGEAFVGSVLAPLDLAPPAGLARYDCRNNRLLLAALAQIAPAVEAARERYGAHRIGVVLGTSTSGIEAAEAAFVYQAQAGGLPANFNYRQMEIGTAAPFAAAALGLQGPAFTISTACTSSAKAFVSARRLLQLRLCDAVVVGGVDSLCELTVQGFASLESTSARARQSDEPQSLRDQRRRGRGRVPDEPRRRPGSTARGRRRIERRASHFLARPARRGRRTRVARGAGRCGSSRRRRLAM